MPMEWKYRGRVITADDINFIQQFMNTNSGISRRKLSAKLCEVLQWKQANGVPCDMVCRSLLLMLDRVGRFSYCPWGASTQCTGAAAKARIHPDRYDSD